MPNTPIPDSRSTQPELPVRWHARLPLPAWVHGVVAASSLMIAISACVWLADSVSKNVVKETLDEELIAMARIAAQRIDAGTHATLTDPAQQNNETYKLVVAPLRDMLSVTPEFKYMYTMRPTPEGLRFVVDAADPVDADHDGVIDQSTLGEVYDEADPAMLETIETGEAHVSPKPKTDKWGTFISAFAPVNNPNGALECIVGVDSTAEKYLARLARIDDAAWRALIVAAVCSIGMGMGVFAIQRRRFALDKALIASKSTVEKALRESVHDRNVLELLANGRPLNDVLSHLVTGYESFFPGMRGSVLLLDPDGRHLRHGAAPSLPSAYCQAIDGVEIGPDVGSCGTAAYTRKTTIVEDIARDPLWRNFKDLALSYGLQSCWSMPILGSAGRVLGTLAFYFNTPRIALPSELAILEHGATMASLGIERHRAETSLATTTELLERTSEMAKVGGWELDLHSMKLFWSAETRRIHEIDPDVEPTVESAIDFYVPHARPVIHAAVQAGIDSGTPWDLELELVTARGRHIWARAQGSAIMENGKAIKLVGAFQDITARKHAELMLTESENRTRLVIDTALDAVVAMDPRGIVVQWNAQAQHIFGWSAAEAVGRPMDSLIIPEPYRAMHRAGLARFIAGGEAKVVNKRIEVPALRKDGTTITIELAITPVNQGSSGEIWFSAFLRDITERKHAEERLRATNVELVEARKAAELSSLAKSAFLANMSHEIRTPLTAILGFADLLREDGTVTHSPEQRTQIIDTIRSAGTHLLTVINDILDLSKIEADKMAIEKIDTPLVDVVREVESMMRPRATDKGVTLDVVLATAVPERIASDPTRLRQILMNLVGNAVKFTEKGSVTITATIDKRGAQQRLVIDIDDTGPGLTPEHASRLFQAFGQADATVTRKYGGTGLGLTICRRLATLMGGDVTLLRTEPGKGSCFRLDLPLEAVPGSAMVTRLNLLETVGPPVTPVSNVKLNGRILLAEDGADNKRLISFHLRKAGATVDIADNGRIALEMLDKAAADALPYDLLLTDMQMPEIDGYTLARTLRSRGNTLAIVALTAHAMAEDRAKCIEAGCNDYATKPIDKPALLTTCALWMGKSGGAGLRSQAA